MKNSLLKYKIGLLVVAVFTIGLLVFLLSEASATKQDADTFQKASQVADKLNAYVYNNQAIPNSLSAAGINDAPDSISYKKLSNSAFRFCVTYKTKSTDFSASSVETNLITSAIARGSDYSGQVDNSELFLEGTHNKGQQCQTIKPNFFNFNGAPASPVNSGNSGSNSTSSSGSSTGSGSGSSAGSSASDPYAKCNAIQGDSAWQTCVSQVQQSQQTSAQNQAQTLMQ